MLTRWQHYVRARPWAADVAVVLVTVFISFPGVTVAVDGALVPAPRWPGYLLTGTACAALAAATQPTPRRRGGYHRLCHRPRRAGLHTEPAAARAGHGRAVLHRPAHQPQDRVRLRRHRHHDPGVYRGHRYPGQGTAGHGDRRHRGVAPAARPPRHHQQAADRLRRGRARPRRVRRADQRGRGAAPGRGGTDADRQGTARRHRPPPRPGQRPGRHGDPPDGHRAGQRAEDGRRPQRHDRRAGGAEVHRRPAPPGRRPRIATSTRPRAGAAARPGPRSVPPGSPSPSPPTASRGRRPPGRT